MRCEIADAIYLPPWTRRTRRLNLSTLIQFSPRASAGRLGQGEAVGLEDSHAVGFLQVVNELSREGLLLGRREDDGPLLSSQPEPTLDTLRSLGVGLVRVAVIWGAIAPPSATCWPPTPR